jgi:hypothetical protein
MSSTVHPPTTRQPSRTVSSDVYRLSDEATAHEGPNFFVLTLYQVVMRTGWIFKTESIVMPAVLDTLTGGGPLGGLLRGCLPALNRFGHSIPPVLFSRRLKILPQKRSAVIVCTLWMATMFFVLAGMWWIAGTMVPWWMPLVFLSCYAMFFVATGINNVSFGTLQGKLIHATRRGRLLLAANVIGAAAAILAASVLMPRWLTPEGGRFEMMFGFAAICFVVASVALLLTVEPKDRYEERDRGVGHLFASAWSILRNDDDFRRLALVAMAFGSSLALFPHYQALGRSSRLSLSFDNLVVWVVIQNFGTALFSLLAGPIADRRGNRLVMQLVMAGVAAMPVVAIGLSHWKAWGATLYPAVFLLIGLTPVGYKTLSNFTLELSAAEDHPRYLSTLGLCFALPLFLSPALGWVVEVTAFEMGFFAISGVVFLGWLLTFRLHEPRMAVLADTLAVGMPDDE